MHIWQHIKNLMKSENVTVTSLALKIGTTRTNMHKILRKENVDIALLLRISKELHHDFFKDISEEMFSNR